MRKIISVLLIIFMLFGMTTLCYGAQNNSENFVNKEDVERASELLEAAGVVIDFESASVNRAAFLKALIDALGIDSFDKDETCFYDVTADDSYNPALNTALNLGIVSEGKYFRPYDSITYSEACKMMVVSLGYNSYAIAQGGYPYGYMTVASKLELDRGFETGDTEVLGREQCIILLANMLEADMLVMDKVVSDGDNLIPEYNGISSILCTMYNWYPVEGVVTANSVTEINGEASDCSDECIVINGINYKTDYHILPGSYVEGYAKKIDGRERIMYLYSDLQSELTLYSSADPVISDKKVIYLDSDNKEKSASLDENYSVIYNGKSNPSFNKDDVDFDIGKIVMINSDTDSDYDVMYIYNGEVSYIDFVNPDVSVAVDSFRNVSYDLQDKEKYHVYSDGYKVISGAVAKGSVVEVYTSKDNTYTEIHIVSETVSGEIEEKDEDGLVIDGVKYFYTDYFKNKYLSSIKLRSSGTFILTACGKLAVSTVNPEVTSKLGYAYKFKFGTGIDNGYMMKVFTEDGDHMTYEAAQKIKLNGQNVITPQELALIFENTGETIIRYSTNTDGKINSVQIPDAEAGSTSESIYDWNIDGVDALKPYVIEGLDDDAAIIYKVFGVFVPYFMINDNTKIFCVDPTQSRDEDKYSIGSTTTWENDSSILKGNIKAYNVTEIGRAGVLVVNHEASSSLGNGRGLLGGVIESVSDAIDQEGNNALKIVLYGKGKYANLYIPENHNKYAQAKRELDFGDFIVYSVDKQGNILEYDKDFDFSDCDIIHASGGDNDGITYYYGTLSEADEAGFSIDLLDSSTATKSKICVAVREDGGITSIANVHGEVISGLSYSQLANYKNQGYEVFVRTYCAEPFQIVVYQR